MGVNYTVHNNVLLWWLQNYRQFLPHHFWALREESRVWFWQAQYFYRGIAELPLEEKTRQIKDSNKKETHIERKGGCRGCNLLMQPNLQTPLEYFVKISFCPFPWWVGEGSSIFRLSLSSKKPAFGYLDSIARPTFILGKKYMEIPFILRIVRCFQREAFYV